MRKIYEKYMHAFKDNDIDALDELFAEDATYVEYMGLEYIGLKEIKAWFKDWHDVGKILSWDIISVKKEDEQFIVEWRLKYDYENEVGVYDALAVVDFNDEGKMTSCQEFGCIIPEERERPYKGI